MVEKQLKDTINLNIEDENTIKEDIKWTTIKLSEVIGRGKRIEASVYDIDAKHARDVVTSSKYGYLNLIENSLLEYAYTRPRFKRIWVQESDFPIYQPTSILDINPKPDGFLSELTNTDIDALRVHSGQILITCSGTIGNSSLVTKTLDKKIFSHDLLRVKFKEEVDNSFFYAFLKTNTGKLILNSNKYGSVISHIEADHLKEVIMPNAPYIIKKEIHDRVMESYRLRDQANDLIEKGTNLLIQELNLISIDNSTPEEEVKTFSTRLSNLNHRLEASYHNPDVNEIENYIINNMKHTPLNNLIKNITLPGRFSRVYVDEENGIPFLGGKDLFQLSSNTGKYLSSKAHKDRLEQELLIKPNSIIMPSRGTLGKVMLAMPQQVGKCAISDNLIQMEFSPEYVGYVFAFLNSSYGEKLIYREKYGGVVNAIEPSLISEIMIPLLDKTDKIKKINDLMLEANEMRHEAFQLEKQAIDIMENKILEL